MRIRERIEGNRIFLEVFPDEDEEFRIFIEDDEPESSNVVTDLVPDSYS